jgi:hypothetical protein
VLYDEERDLQSLTPDEIVSAREMSSKEQKRYVE